SGWHYIGSCGNIEERLKRHNQNSVRSTKHKGPFKVVYKEEFSGRSEARKRELEIKGYKGNDRYKRLLVDSVPIV
ncbi:MAG: GIY-YIG nuclease family protein, partial [Candidatus Omnitrophota bacterium]